MADTHEAGSAGAKASPRPTSTCAYCADTLTGREEVACARCRTRYHRRCWADYRRCAVYGCNSRAFIVPDTCCGDDLDEGKAALQDPPPRAPVEFTRRNPVLTVLLAFVGGTLGIILLVFAIEVIYFLGLLPPDAVTALVLSHGWALLLGSYLMGAALLAAGAKERLRLDFARRRLLVQGTWFGLSGLTSQLCDLDEIEGLQIDADRAGRLHAYLVIGRSHFANFRFASMKLFTDTIADAAQSWLGRTRITSSPPAGEAPAQGHWLSRLEDLAETLDVSIRLPDKDPVLKLLPPRVAPPSLPGATPHDGKVAPGGAVRAHSEPAAPVPGETPSTNEEDDHV